MKQPLTRWPETFATSFLRCPKCGRKPRCRKTEVITAETHTAEFVCKKCKIVIPAIATASKVL